MAGAAALLALLAGDETAFLSFPLGVLLPALAFVFPTGLLATRSAEGALMRLGSLVHLLLIVALPAFALYLVLGFPVVFLLIELFEMRLGPAVREPLKGW